MRIKCAGGCGRTLKISRKHQGADNNQYWCFHCSEDGKIPNPDTVAAMEAAERGEVTRYDSVDAMFKDLNLDEPTDEPEVKGEKE
jgi:hypothetical protein